MLMVYTSTVYIEFIYNSTLLRICVSVSVFFLYSPAAVNPKGQPASAILFPSFFGHIILCVPSVYHHK